METQKIVNLLNDTDNENSKFVTKKWNIINSESKGNYLPDNRITFLTSSLESSLCDYSAAYVLVKGNITVTGGNANTKVAFKNVHHLKNAEQKTMRLLLMKQNILILIMCNLIEYSDNYSDTSGSLCQFKRDEQPKENNGDLSNANTDNSLSFKYKSNLNGTVPNGGRKN